jgi:hypothetical protein
MKESDSPMRCGENDILISRKSENKIAEVIRKSRFHRRTNRDIYWIAAVFNPKILGWINYYDKFGMS